MAGGGGRLVLRIQPSPYNIVVVYRRVVQFTDQAIQVPRALLASETDASANCLHQPE